MPSTIIVLVVEDEPFVSLSLADALEAAGYHILEAPNADKAIQTLESRTDVSFVITDIDMPGSMDGLKLAAAVADRWPPVRIIVVSGHHTLDTAKIPNGSVFFAKPYRTESIVAAMRHML